MAKFVVRHGVKIMANESSEVWVLSQSKEPKDAERLKKHLNKLDEAWRGAEGRKPKDQLNEREKMLEGLIPWDPARLKELNKEL